MCVRRLMTFLAGMALVGSVIIPTPAAAQDYEVYPLEARVWLDRGEEPVLQRGDRARIYYRVSESAFVGIFHVDTNGTVRMVFPSSPQENHYARAGRDYRVLFPGSSYWYVADDPGVGYFFIVASPEPFDFRDLGYSHFAGGWDLSHVGQQVYGDPYLAMDDFVASLIPDWEYVGYGLDFTSYHVDRHYDYPRFLCYDCHGFQPYRSWNPYVYSCTSFRVVIYNDPYYYPATRYRGTRVVYAQPRRGMPHFGFKERAVGESGSPQVVVRNTPPVVRPGVEGNGNRRAVPRAGTPSAFSPGNAGGNPTGVTGQSRPGVEGSATRRTGSTSSPATTRSTVRTDPAGARISGTTPRPVLQRRPSGTATRSTPTGRSSGAATRSTPTVRSGGTATRSTPTARRSGTATRSTPTVRSGGTATRSTPTVRSGGTATRSTPTVRSGGAATRGPPTIRSSGSPGRTAPRVTKPRTPPKPKKPRGGGGG